MYSNVNLKREDISYYLNNGIRWEHDGFDKIKMQGAALWREVNECRKALEKAQEKEAEDLARIERMKQFAEENKATYH